MLIATSLIYSSDEYEINKQRKAMQTWRNIGFDIISCNVKEEINKLIDIFPEVRFEELKRSGKEETGKPFPFIYDMLRVLQTNCQNDVCAIVNSDIFIKNLNGNILKSFFSSHKDTMLILHRYDIDDEKDERGEYYFSGIDVFFFLCHFLPDIPDKGYMLGRPEWDHWFVYEATRAGIEVKEIKNKMAFHIKHKQRWTASDSNKMIKNQISKFNEYNIDEEYYFKTNELMADLSKRIYYDDNFFGEKESVRKHQGYYCDINRDELLKWERNKLQESNGEESVGILYFKERKPYRLCASHCQLKKREDGLFTIGEIFEGERDKGNILKYVDFKDFDFFHSLKNVYVYPAGRAARLLIDCLDSYNVSVLGMIDRDETLHGKTYKGKTIFGLSVLDEKEVYDYVIIATNLYVKEIYESLSKKVSKEKLIVL